MSHQKRIEIRWRDLDSYGHVNQAVYLTYAEEVLDDWFRTKLGRDPGVGWDYVARRTTIDYRGELRLADRVAVGSAELAQLGTTSLTARVMLSAPDGRVATELELVIVAIDGKGGALSLTRAVRLVVPSCASSAEPTATRSARRSSPR